MVGQYHPFAQRSQVFVEITFILAGEDLKESRYTSSVEELGQYQPPAQIQYE